MNNDINTFGICLVHKYIEETNTYIPIWILDINSEFRSCVLAFNSYYDLHKEFMKIYSDLSFHCHCYLNYKPTYKISRDILNQYQSPETHIFTKISNRQLYIHY